MRGGRGAPGVGAEGHAVLVRGIHFADAVALLLIPLFALLICWPVLQGRVPVASDTLALWSPWSQLPHEPVRNSAVADSAHQFLPWMVFARQTVAAGEWPLWDPYTFSGSSFAANSQNQLYYPVSWLLWLLPLSVALQLLAVFNISLAGWGMYAFTRRSLGVSRTGSLLAALAFAGSGMLQSAINAIPMASVYGWLPWILLAADRAITLASWRWTALAVLFSGLMIVAGQLQWVVYALFAIACWLVFRTVQLWRNSSRQSESEPHGPRTLQFTILRSTVVLAGGPLLAAVHLAPFLELSALSARTGVLVSSNSEPLYHLLRLALPEFFGTPLVIPGYSLGSSNLWYVGLLPLLLAPFAVIVWWRSRRKRPEVSDGERAEGNTLSLRLAPAPFWAALGLFSILVAHGVGPFLYVRWLPGMNATLPIRIGYLLILSLSVLVGLGYDSWLRLCDEQPHLARRALVGVAIGIVAVLGLAATAWAGQQEWTRRGIDQQFIPALLELQRDELVRGALLAAATLIVLGVMLSTGWRALHPGGEWRGLLASCLVVALMAVDLLTTIPGFTSFVSPDLVLPATPGIGWLRSQPGEWRLQGVDNPIPSFVPNSHLPFGLATVSGYESFHTRRYDEFWRAVDPTVQLPTRSNPYANVFVRPQAYTSTLASLLNVKFVAVAGDLSSPPWFRKVYAGEIAIFENTRVLPRAFLVGEARVLSPTDVLARLGEADFDPAREVLVEREPPAWLSPDGLTAPQGEVAIVGYGRNSVVIETSLTGPGWLVLSDANYPGWSVSVDGESGEIYTADYILRAVPMQAGRHRVVFSFLPSAFWPTLAISLVMLAIVLAVLLFPSRGTRNSTSSRSA